MKLVNKLFVSTILATMFLTGCATTKPPEVTPAPAENATKTEETTQTVESAKKIVLFQSKVEIIDQLEALAVEYKAETGVEVEVIGTTGDDYYQQLKMKLGNDQGPTIFSLAPGSEVEQMKPYLEDLSSLSFVNDIADGMAVKIEDKVVGIPYTVEGFGMVYNKTLIDPAKVNSYDAFTNMLKEQKANGVNGFGLSQEGYFLIGHILNTPFALQKDPKDFVEKLGKGEVKMSETPEFIEFAKFYATIRELSYNPLEVNYDKETGDFANAKTASIHQGNWSYGMFKDYDLKFEMGLMGLPIAGNDKLSVSVPTVWSINGQASETEKEAGKNFITWLYTSETGKRYITEEFGFIPVIKGMKSEKLDPLSQEVARFTDEGKTITWATNFWPAGIVDVYLYY